MLNKMLSTNPDLDLNTHNTRHHTPLYYVCSYWTLENIKYFER